MHFTEYERGHKDKGITHPLTLCGQALGRRVIQHAKRVVAQRESGFRSGLSRFYLLCREIAEALILVAKMLDVDRGSLKVPAGGSRSLERNVKVEPKLLH